MANPFGTPGMGAGYAAFRPALHPRIIERVRLRLGSARKFRRALDVGCGAGLSTRPLESLAAQCFGLDPAGAMLKYGATTAPRAHFAAGRAEAMPFRARSFDLITAAGSLNYADLERFFPEAARILQPGGVLVVYDFSTGSTFRGAAGLEEWFAEFVRRHPWPPCEAAEISPARLAALDCGFRLESHETFDIALTLSPEFYLEYMLTETNVAFALRRGVPLEEIRGWCATTLPAVFGGRAREVLFRGYIAYLAQQSS